MKIYRQGDILIKEVEVSEVPTYLASVKLKREGGRIILARGEVTGHAHAIATRGVKAVSADGMIWLSSDKPFSIRHEEHAAIDLPAGTFQVIRQREYAPDAIRRVED